MAYNLFKKPRIEESFKTFECCICGDKGHYGFADIFQISLRENDERLNFNDVVFFTVGINVQKELSDICAKCKPKIIEFYHFKKKSQNVQKNFSQLLQEIMKIVGNYITKNAIKAVTIEESKEKLTIMEKLPSLKISEVTSICDVQIKKEPDSIEDDSIATQIEIKKEPEDIPEIYELPMASINSTENDTLNTSITEPSEKLDIILNINKEILHVVKSLQQFNECNKTG